MLLISKNSEPPSSKNWKKCILENQEILKPKNQKTPFFLENGSENGNGFS